MIEVSERMQEKLHAMTLPSEDEIRVKLASFYNSEYVGKNRPEIRAVPMDEWIERQIRLRQVMMR